MATVGRSNTGITKLRRWYRTGLLSFIIDQTMTEIENLLTICRQWAERESEITPVEALTMLTQFYMEQCGVSLALRTLAYEAGDYWLYKLSLTDHPLSDRVDKEPFTKLMPHFSEEFAKNKDYYWEYDITFLYESTLIAGATDIVTDRWLDDKFKIAFVCGFVQYYMEYKEFERTFNAWQQSKNKPNGNINDI